MKESIFEISVLFLFSIFLKMILFIVIVTFAPCFYIIAFFFFSMLIDVGLGTVVKECYDNRKNRNF